MGHFCVLHVGCLCHVHAHPGHEGCGHRRVALESRKWSEWHTQAKEQQDGAVARPSQQDEDGLIPQSAGEQAAAAANKDSLSNLGVRDNDGQRHLLAEVPAATNSVPIRIWVEYQGLSRLQQDLQKDLLNTVNIALGVLAKYFKVSTSIQWI